MPELPEVEILVRHLAPLLEGKKIRDVEVRRARVLGPTSEAELARAVKGATFFTVTRRGKYLLFELQRRKPAGQLMLVGHLGMTGRMYLLAKSAPLPKHAAVVAELGPEPLSAGFSEKYFATKLKCSTQSIKVKLLDLGNIYASEALFRARISPRTPARKLSEAQVKALRRAIREVLNEAIRCGSTLPLDFPGKAKRGDGLFYYGNARGASEFYEERLLVYGREARACVECGKAVRRLVQAARSTFYCPGCQR